MKRFLRVVVLSFSLISTGLARFEENPASRDGRFTVGTLPGSETLAIFDREGVPVLRFDDEESSRGTNVFWSPDSQRLLIFNQRKSDFRLDAAELVDGEWKMIPSQDVDKKVDEQAEAVLGIRLRQGSWSNFGSYFEGVKWLSNVIIEYTASNTNSRSDRSRCSNKCWRRSQSDALPGKGAKKFSKNTHHHTAVVHSW